MSAIAGVCSFENECAGLETTVRQMTAAMPDLGRDSETFLAMRHAAFGHLLSRFTEEDEFERQPLTSPLTGDDGRIALVCAARIDNRKELAEALRISPSSAALMPDSAFILAAYRKWGDQFASRLVGSFAIAIYNERERNLILARSPGGEYSLFYWADRQRLMFATAPRALFATGAVSRRLNLQKTADFLVTMHYDQTNTWYEGVETLTPGHVLSVNPEGRRLWRYWRPEDVAEIRYPRDADYVEAFLECWRRVVADHTRARRAPGILMSGGMDSTAVAAMAAPELARGGKKLAAFTEVPPVGFNAPVFAGRYADETPYVQAMARHFPNLELSLIRTPSSFFLDGVESWFRAAETPFRNSFNRQWWQSIIETASNRGIQVLLTGQGGNLTVSWSGSGLMTQLLTRGHWVRAWREARAMAAAGLSSSAIAAVGGGIMPYLGETAWLAISRIRHRGHPELSATPPWTAYSLIRYEFAKERKIAERAREVGHTVYSRPTAGLRQRTLQWSDWNGDYRRGELSLYGVELRDPPFDRRVVEFCLGVPEDQSQRNGVSKWLLRRAMAGLLPDAVLNNQKRGLQAANWLDQLSARGRALQELELLKRSPLASHALDLVRMEHLLNHPTVDLSKAGSAGVNYQAMLAIGLMTGRFLRWTETRT